MCFLVDFLNWDWEVGVFYCKLFCFFFMVVYYVLIWIGCMFKNRLKLSGMKMLFSKFFVMWWMVWWDSVC